MAAENQHIVCSLHLHISALWQAGVTQSLATSLRTGKYIFFLNKKVFYPVAASMEGMANDLDEEEGGGEEKSGSPYEGNMWTLTNGNTTVEGHNSREADTTLCVRLIYAYTGRGGANICSPAFSE